jgi:hypothetical protein
MKELNKFKLRTPPNIRGLLGPGDSASGQTGAPPTVEQVVKEFQDSRRAASATLIAVDATGSMQPHWNHLQQKMTEMIDRLSSAGGSPRLKFVAYRDHCDGARIIQESPFSSDAAELKRFVSGMSCAGGGDRPKAVDRALAIAVAEQEPIGAVVLIGDAPPHTDSDGQTEARRLGAIQRPVYAIVVGGAEDTRAAFQLIAQLSGGKLLSLDRLEELYEIIGVVIAHSMGGDTFREYLRRRALPPGAVTALAVLTDRKGK